MADTYQVIDADATTLADSNGDIVVYQDGGSSGPDTITAANNLTGAVVTTYG